MQDSVDESEGVDEREVVQKEGWMDLIYSFLASGIMTVSLSSVSLVSLIFLPARSILLSDRFLCATLWKVPRSRMAVVIHP